MKTEITITKIAAEQINDYAKESEKPSSIRLEVLEEDETLMFQIELADNKEEDEEEFISNNVKIYLKKEYVDMLQGTTIDYVKDEKSEGFVINNPNMEQGCCGSGSCGNCDDKTDKKDNCCGGCC